MTGGGAAEDALTLRIDGGEPLSAETVKALGDLCDQAEDRSGPGVVTVRTTGAPGDAWSGGLDIPLVTKWERVLRRLEKLPRATVAVASGDCGGTALDAFLATDVRVASPDTRLVVPRDGEATWPGMAVHRLVQQAGAARVRKAVLLGSPIEAREALGMALVDELADEPGDAAVAASAAAGSLSGRELALRRRLLLDATTTSFEDALGAHLAACDRALRRGAEEAV